MTARARRIIAEIKTAAPLTGDRGFESRFLQRGVLCEPDWLLRDRDRGGTAGAGQNYDSYGGVAGEPREPSWVSRLSSTT
jgi:hypothetical protein